VREGFRHIRLNNYNGEPVAGEYSAASLPRITACHLFIFGHLVPLRLLATFLLAATLFVYITKDNGLQRSAEWFAKHAHPPMYLLKEKRAAIPKLHPVGIKAVDDQLSDMQSAVKKIITLREKVSATS
jgi:hypothetical protein